MYRAFLYFAAMVSCLALFLAMTFNGLSFLPDSIEDLLAYIGAIAVLVFTLILIVLGIKALFGNTDDSAANALKTLLTNK